jgi:HEAT repeat protein
MQLGFIASRIAVTMALAVLYATAQSVGDDHRIIPFKESLQARGIDLSHASLAAALHNQDPQIRSQAAAVLAENQDQEAASLIEAALASEPDPKTMVELASTLMSLGDAAGTKRLVEICTSDTLPTQTVTYAIFQLVLEGSDAQCIDKLIQRFKNPDKVDSEAQMVPMLGPLYRLGSPAQKVVILTVIQHHLSDTGFEARMAASRALAQTASPGSSNMIRAALQRETDPIVRSSMQNDLTTLGAP